MDLRLAMALVASIVLPISAASAQTPNERLRASLEGRYYGREWLIDVEVGRLSAEVVAAPTEELEAVVRGGFLVAVIAPTTVPGSSDALGRVALPAAIDVGIRRRARGEWLSAHFGLALSVPLRTSVDLDEDFALAIAGAMGGNWDRWRWQWRALAFSAPVRVELDLHENVAVAFEGAAVLLVPVARFARTPDGTIAIGLAGFATRDVAIAGQAGLEAAARLAFVSVGLRTRLAIDPYGHSPFELSFDPFAEVEIGAARAEIDVLVNATKPWGPSFEGDAVPRVRPPVWSVGLTIGAELW
jgi:hypothetical protein